MNWDEIRRWLNDNQGVVIVAIFILGIFFSWISGLLKLIIRKLLTQKPHPNRTQAIEAGRDVIVESQNINIFNIETTGFSDLKKQVSDMENSGLKGVLNKVNLSKPTKSPPKSESADYKRVMTVISGEPTATKKEELKSLFYSSTDNTATLQSAIALASWFAPFEDKIDDLIGICDEGVRVADMIGAASEKAVLLAYKGKFVSLQFSLEDMQAAVGVQASNLADIPIIAKEQREKIIQKIQRLDKISQQCFASAQQSAKKANSYGALALVYTLIGQAAGERYLHFEHFGVNRAEDEKRLSKRALILAKEIYSALGDELGSGYALHSLANQLRLFGENEEAKRVVEKVIRIAKKHNDQQLLKKARTLLKRI